METKLMVMTAACGEGVTLAESCVTWNCDMYTNGKLRKDKSLNLAADGWYVEWVQGSQHGYVPPEYKGRDFVREQE